MLNKLRIMNHEMTYLVSVSSHLYESILCNLPILQKACAMGLKCTHDYQMLDNVSHLASMFPYQGIGQERCMYHVIIEEGYKEILPPFQVGCF